MKVRYEYTVRTEEKEVSGGYGETSLRNPVMIYSQIPIEKMEYAMLECYCRENKITVYDLLSNAIRDAIEGNI